MGRSNYCEDDDDNTHGLWRGAVSRAIEGKRGQAFLRELAAALDAMPVKELIAEELVTEEGKCCAMGAVALARKLDVSKIEETDSGDVGEAFGIARALAAEIAYENDDDFGYGPRGETPAQRWQRMRAWVRRNTYVATESESEGT